MAGHGSSNGPTRQLLQQEVPTRVVVPGGTVISPSGLPGASVASPPTVTSSTVPAPPTLVPTTPAPMAAVMPLPPPLRPSPALPPAGEPAEPSSVSFTVSGPVPGALQECSHAGSGRLPAMLRRLGTGCSSARSLAGAVRTCGLRTHQLAPFETDPRRVPARLGTLPLLPQVRAAARPCLLPPAPGRQLANHRQRCRAHLLCLLAPAVPPGPGPVHRSRGDAVATCFTYDPVTAKWGRGRTRYGRPEVTAVLCWAVHVFCRACMHRQCGAVCCAACPSK